MGRGQSLLRTETGDKPYTKGYGVTYTVDIKWCYCETKEICPMWTKLKNVNWRREFEIHFTKWEAITCIWRQLCEDEES